MSQMFTPTDFKSMMTALGFQEVRKAPTFELVTPPDTDALDPLRFSLQRTAHPIVCRIDGVALTLKQLERRTAYGMPTPRQARMLLAVAERSAA